MTRRRASRTRTSRMAAPTRRDPRRQQTIGVGGPQPGEWVFPTCAGPGVDRPDAAGVGDQRPAGGRHGCRWTRWWSAAGGAAARLRVADDRDGPAVGQPAVGGRGDVAVDRPGRLAGRSPRSASAGPVTATATAAPSKVVWDMGDGDSVTCDGPGTPYSASDPNATTDCSYTWPQAGSLHGDGDRLLVGDLDGGRRAGRREPRASRPARRQQVQVTVTESQAINTPTGWEQLRKATTMATTATATRTNGQRASGTPVPELPRGAGPPPPAPARRGRRAAGAGCALAFTDASLHLGSREEVLVVAQPVSRRPGPHCRRPTRGTGLDWQRPRCRPGRRGVERGRTAGGGVRWWPGRC